MKNAKTAFIIILLVCSCVFAQDWKFPIPNGMKNYDENITIVPESERFLNFVIFGLWPNSGKYYFLPELNNLKGFDNRQIKEVEKQFYWLNYELSHGKVLNNLPGYTHLYVAIPDRKYVPESRGGEKEYYIEFLKEKRGFTDEDIKHRVHFFKSLIQLEWAQDACKILGREEDGRVVIGYSEGDSNPYLGTMTNLEKAFPKDFKLKKFDNSLSAEGGDEDLVWQSPGKVAFIAGRNRVLAYLERKYNESYEDVSISQELIEEARKAYSDGVYGIDVFFMPEKILRNPSLGCKETFHLDMISTTMPRPDGKGYRAFVPSYGKEAYDAITLEKLDPKLMKAAQGEYNLTAEQFKKMGYEVTRLVFNDHPVRNPVNIGRFRNKESGKYTVMLAKYPNHLPVSDPDTSQARLNAALEYLNNETLSWFESKSKTGHNNVMSAVNNLWAVMDDLAAAPNPVYQAQYDIFKKLGYEIITIPVYAWGAGGLHCQMMY